MKNQNNVKQEKSIDQSEEKETLFSLNDKTKYTDENIINSYIEKKITGKQISKNN